MLRACLGIISLVSAYSASAAGQETTTVAEAKAGPSHPPEVALVDEGPRGSVYRQFETSLRLYVSDRDPVGTSTCYEGCIGPWVPVYAPTDAEPVGDWQVLRRDDGKRQWMLEGKPVYTRFHDAPDTVTGDGADGVWHVVPHKPRPENPTPADLSG